MNAVDTNVLVYAHREELARHEQALRLLESLAEGDAPWAIPIFCIGEFLRIVTHPRLFDPPTPLEEAISAIQALIGSRCLSILLPGQRYWPILSRVLMEGNATGNRVFDAQIAALCIEHGIDVIVTEDRGFLKLQGLRAVPIQ